MSEEQPVESEKPKGEPEPKPQPDAPWSAPPITEAPESSVDLEPLTPLKPTLADALSGALMPETEPPAFPDFGELFTPQEQTAEGTPRPLLRPVTPISSEYCREGGLGFCMTCSSFPCKQMLTRCLRHLLTITEYGTTPT